MNKFDYAVVGGGSAGVRSARVASKLGKKTVLFEKKQLGGTCVNVGCVPKKIYSYASHFAEMFHDAGFYGWHIPESPTFNLSKLAKEKDKEIHRLNDIYENLLNNANVEIVRGGASFKENGVLEANGQCYSADKILLAPGGKPFKPKIPGIEKAWVSDDVFRQTTLPKTITIVGGGYIAVEMASIFNGWGSRVNLVYRGDKLLKKFDADIGKFLTSELIKKGINVELSTQITDIMGEPGNLSLEMSDGKTYQTEQILYATGRITEVEALNLAKGGVNLHPNNKIIVSEQFQTSNPNVYAAGDVCHAIELTPTAIKQGEMIAQNLFGGKSGKFDVRNVPSAVFSSPPVATVGDTEAAAAAEEPVSVYYSDMRPLKYSITDNTERTMMKLVVSKKTGRVRGIHMVGVYAAEIIQGFAVAVKLGATIQDFNATVGVHPSSAEELVTMSTPREN